MPYSVSFGQSHDRIKWTVIAATMQDCVKGITQNSAAPTMDFRMDVEKEDEMDSWTVFSVHWDGIRRTWKQWKSFSLSVNDGPPSVFRADRPMEALISATEMAVITHPSLSSVRIRMEALGATEWLLGEQVDGDRWKFSFGMWYELMGTPLRVLAVDSASAIDQFQKMGTLLPFTVRATITGTEVEMTHCTVQPDGSILNTDTPDEWIIEVMKPPHLDIFRTWKFMALSVTERVISERLSELDPSLRRVMGRHRLAGVPEVPHQFFMWNAERQGDRWRIVSISIRAGSGDAPNLSDFLRTLMSHGFADSDDDDDEEEEEEEDAPVQTNAPQIAPPEVCPICMERPPDKRVQPCMHWICTQCLLSALIERHQCPFCRRKITGTLDGPAKP